MSVDTDHSTAEAARREDVFICTAREALRLAEEAKALPGGTAERTQADNVFSLALGRMMMALDHPLAASRARLTDTCVAAVERVAEAQSTALALAEDSAERDVANADTIAAYVELGRAVGVERMLEERVAHHVGERVPELGPEAATYFQEAAARVLYDLGGLMPRLLLTLAGSVMSLPEGHHPQYLRPRHRRRGEVGTAMLEDSLQQAIALRMLLEAMLVNEPGSEWVEDTRPGVSGRTYERWLARATPDEQASVRAIAHKIQQQEPLNEAERQLHERITQRPLRQMLEGLAHLI